MADRLVALVTGANRGLGKETARQLIDRGMTVVLGSRDLERGTAAAGELCADGATVPVQLDVADPASVQTVADQLRREYGRLDVLVNNAGTVVDRPAVATTAAEMRHTYEVNVFGVVTVIHAMLPLLHAATAPRIVNVTSTTASLGLTSDATDFGGDADRRLAYSSSKTALNMLTISSTPTPSVRALPYPTSRSTRRRPATPPPTSPVTAAPTPSPKEPASSWTWPRWPTTGPPAGSSMTKDPCRGNRTRWLSPSAWCASHGSEPGSAGWHRPLGPLQCAASASLWP